MKEAISPAQILDDVLAIIKRDIEVIALIPPTPVTISDLSPTIARYAKTLSSISDLRKAASDKKEKTLGGMSTEDLLNTLPEEQRNAAKKLIDSLWDKDKEEE